MNVNGRNTPKHIPAKKIRIPTLLAGACPLVL